jgi:hypothetical protein
MVVTVCIDMTARKEKFSVWFLDQVHRTFKVIIHNAAVAKGKKKLADKKKTETTEFGSRDFEAEATAEAVRKENQAKRYSPNISRPGYSR